MDHNERQNLIDLVFEIAYYSAKYWGHQAAPVPNQQETHMEWVARQLRNAGYDTVPMGISWGVLKRNDTQPN